MKEYDPDGNPYKHNKEQAEAAKATLAAQMEACSAETSSAAGAALNLVEQWQATAKEMSKQFDALSNVLGGDPGSPLQTAVWGMFSEYTKALAALVGDEEEWLEWYAWECDFGAKPQKMHFSDGETLLVAGPSDLLAAIQANDDGTRKWQHAE